MLTDFYRPHVLRLKTLYGDFSARLKSRVQLQYPPWFKSVFGITLAAGLALQAHQQSASHGASEWRQSHPPTLAMWKSEIQSQGLHLVTLEPEQRALYRKIPDKSGPQGHLWVEKKYGWAAYFPEPKSTFPVFFALNPLDKTALKSKPEWLNLGTHWEAMEIWNTLKWTKATQPQKTVTSADMRELKY